jgi:transketolase
LPPRPDERSWPLWPEEPGWPERDRFILSKGHSSIALYAVLALRGYFPLAELKTFDATGSRLQGHPDMTKLPGIDMSTGSLGLGLGAGVGMALGAKLNRQKFSTFVVVGDGECNEGIVWEAAHVAERYELDNLVVVVDQNGLQQFGWADAGAARGRRAPYRPGELQSRWQAFGWAVTEVDGHDMTALVGALEEARAVTGCPAVLVAHTIKGKGVSFMEDDFSWHSRVPTADELANALAEISNEGTRRPGA